MKILITGSSGFVGHHLIKKIEKIYYTKSINNKTKLANTIFLNIKNIKKKQNLVKLKKFNPDILIHCSWYGIPNLNEKNSKLNYELSFFFINFLIKTLSLKKIIILGSCLEYNFTNKKILHKPTKLFFKSRNIFGSYKKKLYIDLLSSIKKSKNKIDLIWFRIFYLYGLGQNKKSLIPHLINNLKRNRIISLKNTNMVLDYIYIDDLIELILKSIKIKKTSGIFNACTGIGQYVGYIERLIKKKIINIKNQYYKKDNSTIKYMIGDPSKTKKIFKWKPLNKFEKNLNFIIKQS